MWLIIYLKLKSVKTSPFHRKGGAVGKTKEVPKVVGCCGLVLHVLGSCWCGGLVGSVFVFVLGGIGGSTFVFAGVLRIVCWCVLVFGLLLLSALVLCPFSW